MTSAALEHATRRRKRETNRALAGYLSPALIWALLLIVVPYAVMGLTAFWQTDHVRILYSPTLDNLHRLVTDPVVRVVFWRSLVIATVVTVVSLLLAFPLAYVAAFHVRRKRLFVFAVILPMWVGYIIRAYAWRTALGEQGILNQFLLAVGLVDAPVQAFLFSRTAVGIVLVHVYMAFAFVPIYSVLDGIPDRLLAAASDLYAGPVQRLVRVTLPLAAPGIAAGVMFVFPLSLGDYMAPNLVGGPDGIMVGNLIQSQFGVTFNWPFGAALALGLLTLVLIVIWLTERWRATEEVRLL